MKLWIMAGALGVLAVTNAGAVPVTDNKPKADITVDTTKVVNLQKWAEDSGKLAREWYPRIVEILGAQVPKEPVRVRLEYKYYDGIAATGGETISVNTGWVLQHPDDMGLVVHELTHVVQHYPKYEPIWLTEGIADYVRWWCYEPKAPRTPINFARASYKDSYRTTAAFLAWAEGVYPGLVKQANAVMQKGAYTDGVWKEWTGKTADELWAEFRQAKESAAKK